MWIWPQVCVMVWCVSITHGLRHIPAASYHDNDTCCQLPWQWYLSAPGHWNLCLHCHYLKQGEANICVHCVSACVPTHLLCLAPHTHIYTHNTTHTHIHTHTHTPQQIPPIRTLENAFDGISKHTGMLYNKHQTDVPHFFTSHLISQDTIPRARSVCTLDGLELGRWLSHLDMMPG